MTKGSEATRAAILVNGVRCARDGLNTVTVRRVATAAGLHHSNVAYYFRSRVALLDAVAAYAIQIGDSVVIARLILDRHATVEGLSPMDRDRHMLNAVRH